MLIRLGHAVIASVLAMVFTLPARSIFQNAVSAFSTTMAADDALTPGAATLTNSATAPFLNTNLRGRSRPDSVDLSIVNARSTPADVRTPAKVWPGLI